MPYYARYRYRAYPTATQQRALARTFGAVRLVWNDALALARQIQDAGGKYPGESALAKAVVSGAKKTPERAFLKEVCSDSLNTSVRNLDGAFKRWWRSLKAKGGRRVGAPKFKSKHHPVQSAYFRPGPNLRTRRGVKLTHVGHVKLAWHRPLPQEGVVKSCTMLRDSQGRYWASFSVEMPDAEPLPPAERTVGVHLGFGERYCTLSTGEVLAAPAMRPADWRKLARLERQKARKVKGSRRRRKLMQRLTRYQNRWTQRRHDFSEQASTRLLRENQTVVLEACSVSRQVKQAKRWLRRLLLEAGRAGFTKRLQEKAVHLGREVQLAPRQTPEMRRRCPHCGRVASLKQVRRQSWSCSGCGASCSLAGNTAEQLAAAGRAEAQNGCRVDVRQAVPAVGSEASTPRTVISLGW